MFMEFRRGQGRGQGRGQANTKSRLHQGLGRRIRRRDFSCLSDYAGYYNADFNDKELLEKRKEFLNEKIKEIDIFLLQYKQEQ